MPAKKLSKSTKKTAKKSVKKVTTPVELITPEIISEPTVKMPKLTLPKLSINPKVLATAAVLIGVGLLTYKLGPWIVPAVVDKTPITRWQIYSKLDQSYGAQVLEDMINEAVLNVAIQRSGVKIEQTRIDEGLKKIEKQFESLDGLDEALKTRGMTRDDLLTQVTTQLSVEEILKDKINPTEEEVKKYFDDNSKTLYNEKKFDDVKAEITESLRQGKLRDEFMTWFTEAKKEVNIKNFSAVSEQL